ncbi:transketolase [Salipaludibacillus sp. LMS25]|uniref:transketolase n=1 Tax=Salipaludibacillus sp. LMS25 TaxID=2924031 RepID=UPI0020D18A5D|nr:transketolase [Salipaludibacillus sp. LMS25]UTR17110.1 transketolase [Salipaludibacillus sp. LMS25]
MCTNIDHLSIATIRTLSIDGVEKAQSGHPGMPMGAAPMAYKLFSQFMQHNPTNPDWFNRDRFVLSAGHGSMLLYSLLHLHGYDVTLDDLKNFRQWGSRTPGHPEVGDTPGVEATTGPLGQGVAMSVGFAMAERKLAATYNRDHYNVVDHYTYSICGDGDLMEGVSAEAASLAGHLKLGKLVVLYDSNDISLDGELHQSFSENVEDRFKAYGWQVIRVEDGNDLSEIATAIEAAKADDRPTLIEVKTVIGYGSPNKGGKSASHGAPLGEDEVKMTKEAYKWTFEEDFYVPDEVREHYKQLAEKGQAEEEKWNDLFAEYKKAYPELGEELETAIKGELPANWDKAIPVYEEGDKPATRASGGEVLNAIAQQVPSLFGGSADLASSNKTMLDGEEDFSRDNYSGRNVWFGVREFAMAAAANGMALHGGIRPYVATFFVFSDYLRPALRLSSIMKVPVTYVFTHDSIAVGEDGPTHEPVEQLAALRAMPGISIIRPADGNEVAAAWKAALESKHEPTALVLTRQGLPTLPSTKEKAYEGVTKGAYVVSEANGEANGLLLASGSEVALAVEAQQALEKEGIFVSVVSMPSWDRFEKQSAEYKESVLPSHLKRRLGIEMATTLGWERYTGDEGSVLGIDKFGASAPGDRILQEYGFTVENVVTRFKQLLEK